MAGLTKKTKDISKWYTELIQSAKLADYGPVRGTMVIMPYGYAIWENIQSNFDKAIKKMGVQNAYFPLFIPMSLLQKEKTHVKGFAPELAVVTHGGGEKLAEPLAVRPTSETIMYDMYSKWISSWRDLPLKINQWNNVVRWEKRTYFFLRTLEFLWQEGHTAHATSEEAEEMTVGVLSEYEKIYKDAYAMAGIVGRKSEAEKFAGADHTYTIEFLMPDGKALQGCTSHHLGQNFSKAFNISFQDKNGKNEFVYQTSWGLSTRSIGGLILVHGDDSGLVLPPKLAPIKAVIIPILGKKDEEILKYCKKIKEDIEKLDSVFPGTVEIMDDSDKSYGFRVNEAELKGIPVKITVGTRELYDKVVSVSDRLDILKNKMVRVSEISEKLEEILIDIQKEMYKKSENFLKENTRNAKTYEEFKKIMKTTKGFIKAHWCGDPLCEVKIKEETKASTRCLPLEKSKKEGKCVYCSKKAKDIWYFAQAY
ncbi:MAG: proline--tRNA ligase [Patescibacteria group bacterium]